MKKHLLLFVFACVVALVQAKDYADYVNPLVGTQSTFDLSAGNTYPAISRPWGMNFWTPQTGKMGDGWQYTYTATKIRGFKQTHQPSPWINDYGQFSIMPMVGKAEFDEERIKDIDSVVPNRVKAVEDMIKLAAWLKHNYGGTMNQALKTVIPVKEKIRQKEKKHIKLNVTKEEAKEFIKNAKRKSPSKEKLIEYLSDREEADMDVLKNETGISLSTIKSLENDGIIQIISRQLYRNPVKEDEIQEDKISLNNEQKNIVDDFIGDYDRGIRKTYLIHGVTGSGKTLCYINMIEHVVRQGKQAVMLIPEIALTFQTVKRFYDRFGERVSILNSRMSKGERYDQFLRAMRGEIDVIIGPRSALFTPFSNLGLIVIDEEHEMAYKSEQTPSYHARQTAIHIAQTKNASVVLGSATPSVESYYNAKKGIYKLYELKNRAAGADMPDVAVVDLREELKQGNRSIFSRKLKELIEDRIRKKQQIMLFLNKRGYAGFISCRSCGYVMKCPHCDISLTAHNNGRLVCHYCGYQTGSVKLCPKCGSRYISGFKAGTQQVEEMLKKTFPGIRVLRMDMDTTSGKDGHEKIISEFAAHNADVLVGTQMIVKGHDFPDVTLVGVLAADMSLYTSDFRAGERTFQLLVQAAGRAGRKNLHGDVIIQTYTPDNYSIVAAQKQDYEMFYDDEISFRKLMGYPPVMHMLEVKISSKNEGNLEKSCDDMKKFSDMAGDKKLFITGPVVPQVYKLNDIYTQVLYVKAADYERLTQFKDNIEVHVKDNILYKNVSVQFNFD